MITGLRSGRSMRESISIIVKQHIFTLVCRLGTVVITVLAERRRRIIFGDVRTPRRFIGPYLRAKYSILLRMSCKLKRATMDPNEKITPAVMATGASSTSCNYARGLLLLCVRRMDMDNRVPFGYEAVQYNKYHVRREDNCSTPPNTFASRPILSKKFGHTRDEL